MQAQTQHKNVPTLRQTINTIEKVSKGQLLSASGLHISVLIEKFFKLLNYFELSQTHRGFTPIFSVNKLVSKIIHNTKYLFHITNCINKRLDIQDTSIKENNAIRIFCMHIFNFRCIPLYTLQ